MLGEWISRHGQPEARAACARSRLRGLTSVGWLISNRSSRLAFQWLMMSASFRRSSSRLPILKSRLILVRERNNLPISSLVLFYPVKRASNPTTWNKRKSVTPRIWAFKSGFCGKCRSFPQSPVNAPQLYRQPLLLFPRSLLSFVLSRSVRAPYGKAVGLTGAVRAPPILHTKFTRDADGYAHKNKCQALTFLSIQSALLCTRMSFEEIIQMFAKPAG